MSDRPFRIELASTTADVELARDLFREYAGWLKVDLCFQGFASELAALPGSYAPPAGCLLLAWDGSAAAGCVAMRPLADGACELKRLYVRPYFRGHGLGSTLGRRVIECARLAGHRWMLLDTLPGMTDALRLYERLGFRRRDAYYDTPLRDTVFMELNLTESQP